ncbi:MAG: NAD(P)/FAD-dependent oxidoreductase [Bacteroidota bacterium]|nr:NAD(P)/FAD-dependent oxidoreductase [Bacteroidota bacterium]
MLEDKKHVVVVGAGFGGLQAVKKLSRDKSLSITLIDKTNHHLFQPLLYQIATAVLSPADIAIPSRSLAEKMQNVTVIMDEVTRIDKENNTIAFAGRSIKYDYLILSMGARTGYFGHNDWKKYTSALKNLTDALQIRKRLLLSFEEAENDPSQAGRLLKYIIIGGGPTGVELAGSIAELAHNIVRKDFRNIDTGKAEIILIEGGSDLVPSFDRKLSVYTKKQLEKRGVRVMLNTRVEKIEDKKVFIKTFEGQKILEGNIIIWAAGVEPVQLTTELGVKLDRSKRVIVNQNCSLNEYPNIFVIGDMADFKTENGKSLPGLSPVAMQQGRYVAKFIINKIKGISTKPFHYTDKGNMATIGRRNAIAEYKSFKMTGLLGWLAWLFVHLYYQVGFKNKISILITWMWSYLTFGAGARVILSPIPQENE